MGFLIVICAFSPFGNIAGAASGLYAFLQLAGGAFTSLLVSFVTSASVFFLGGVFCLVGINAFLVFFLMTRSYVD